MAPRARLAASAAAALLPALLLASAPETQPKPDLLLVTVDALRGDRLLLSGYPRATSPQLERWARGGIVYERAYSTSSWTVPAMASLMTGVAPGSHGVVRGVVLDGAVHGQELLPEGLPTLAEQLSAAGYRCFAVSANSHLDSRFGFARGFDRFARLPFGAPADEVNAALLRFGGELLDRSAPVFVWLHYCDPHFPYLRNEPAFSRLLPGAGDHELALVEQAIPRWPRLPAEGVMPRQRYLTLLSALYDSEITFWDEQFARLLELVPRLREAAVLLTADHGEEFCEHGRLGHGANLYQETLRVPMVLRGPGIPPGRRVDSPVSLLDVPVTLLGLARVPAPGAWQGRALPTGDRQSPGERDIVASLERGGTSRHQQALVAGRHKLVLHVATGKLEVYDLEADPGERHDLAPGEPVLGERLLRRLRSATAALPPPPGTRTALPIDPGQVEALRALGYLTMPGEGLPGSE